MPAFCTQGGAHRAAATRIADWRQRRASENGAFASQAKTLPATT